MKLFTKIAAVIFFIISCVHILRFYFDWKIMINGSVLPLWVSVPGFLITAGLAFMLWKESKK